MRLSGFILGSRPLAPGTSSWMAGEEQMPPRSFEWRGTDACQGDLNGGTLTHRFFHAPMKCLPGEILMGGHSPVSTISSLLISEAWQGTVSCVHLNVFYPLQISVREILPWSASSLPCSHRMPGGCSYALLYNTSVLYTSVGAGFLLCAQSMNTPV